MFESALCCTNIKSLSRYLPIIINRTTKGDIVLFTSPRVPANTLKVIAQTHQQNKAMFLARGLWHTGYNNRVSHNAGISQKAKCVY